MNTVLYETKNRIAYITLNRPDKRNALNHAMVRDLTEAFVHAAEDTNSKVIVLRANGEAFCAGADLAYLQQLQNFSPDENLQDSQNLMKLFKTIYTLNKVVIAQVNGHAVAGGCGLVTACDFAFSVSKANFGYSEVKIGFVPAIVMNFLVKKVGEAKAREMLLTGTFIDAEEAKKLHLITKVVEDDKSLAEEVNLFAQKLCNANSGTSMEMTKKLMSETYGMTFEQELKYASELNASARSTEDCKRGISAFLEKRKLEW